MAQKVESLELRLVPTTISLTGDGNLLIDTSDNLSVERDEIEVRADFTDTLNPKFIISDPTQILVTSIPGTTTSPDQHVIEVPFNRLPSTAKKLLINTFGGGDRIILSANGGNLGLSPVINAGGGFDEIGVFASVLVAPSNVDLQLTAEDIRLRGDLTTNGGKITLDGNVVLEANVLLSTVGATSAVVEINGQLDSTPGPSNYTLITTPRNYVDAQAQAALDVPGGYLATIRSQVEQDNVKSTALLNDVWIGASDAQTEGKWKWDGGPDLGVQFWDGDGTTGNGVPLGNPEYSNWFLSEPDNLPFPSNAAFLVGNDAFGGRAGDLGGWADGDISVPRAYVVEAPSAFSLTVNSGTANFQLNGPVGNLLPLRSLDVTANQTSFFGGSISTFKSQTFNSALTLTGPTLLRAEEVDFKPVANSVTGSSMLTLAPIKRDAPITVGAATDAGPASFDITDSDIAALAAGFGTILIGEPPFNVSGGGGGGGGGGGAPQSIGPVTVTSSTFLSPVTIAGGSISVTGLNAGTNRVQFIASTGSITDGGDATPDITAGELALDSFSGVGVLGNGLETTASAIAARAVDTGGVFLVNTGSLSIGTPDSPGGLFTNGGDTSVSSTGSISVVQSIVTNGGNVTLSAVNGIVINGVPVDTAVPDSGGGQFTVDADSNNDGTGTFSIVSIKEFVNWISATQGEFSDGSTVNLSSTTLASAIAQPTATDTLFSDDSVYFPAQPQALGEFVVTQFSGATEAVFFSFLNPQFGLFLHFDGMQFQDPTFNPLTDNPVNLYSFNQPISKVSGEASWNVVPESNSIQQLTGDHLADQDGTVRFDGSVSSLTLTRSAGGVSPGFENTVNLQLGLFRAGGVRTNGGAISIRAADVALDGFVEAGSGVVSLIPSATNRTIDLGASGGSGQFVVTDAELDQIFTGGGILVGNTDSDTITINDAVTRAAATNLSLTTASNRNINFVGSNASLDVRGGIVSLAIGGTGAIVSGGAPTDVTANALTITSGLGGIGTSGIPLTTSVRNLEVVAGSGGVFVSNAGGLTIGGIPGITGVSATGGDIVISASSPLTVDEPVVNSGGGISLAAATINLNSDLSTDGGAVTLTGNTVLGNSITIDTEQGDNSHGGAVTFTGGSISGSTLGFDLNVNTSTFGTNLNGGAINLPTLDNAGGGYLNDLTLDAAGADLSRNGTATLNGNILLDDAGLGFESNLNISGARVVLATSVTIDGEQGGNGETGFYGFFGGAVISASSEDLDLTIDVSSTGSGFGGQVDLFGLDDSAGFFIQKLTVTAVNGLGTSGVVVFDGPGNTNYSLAADGNAVITASAIDFIDSNLLLSGSGAISLDVTRQVFVSDSQLVTANGDITLNANAAGTTNGNFTGIVLEQASVVRTTGTGNIVMEGRSGDGSFFLSGIRGIELTSGSIIEAQSSGTITLFGVSRGTGNAVGMRNDGISLSLDSDIRSNTGPLSLSGTAGSGSSSNGIFLGNDAGTSISSTNAPITLAADSIAIGDSNASITAGTSNTVTLRPLSNNGAINLGAADAPGVLGLTDAEIDRLFAGTLNIGNANSGEITVSEAITRSAPTNVNLTTGGTNSLSFSGAGSLDANGGDVIVSLNAAGTGGVVSGTATTHIAADDLVITSGSGGIGVGGNPLTTNVTRLTFNSTGAVTISEGSNLDLAGSSSGTTVVLSSTGAINDASASATIITANSLVVSAATGIGSGDALETAVSNLEAVGGLGGVFVSNAGGLTIGGIGSITGVSATGGDIVISASSPLSVNEPVVNSGGGNVSLSALGSPGSATDDLTLNANVTASDGNGAITLNAANDILQTAGTVSAAGAGTVALNAGTDTANGVITMSAGTQLISVGGGITLDADGLGSLSEITSSTGEITLTNGAYRLNDAERISNSSPLVVMSGAKLQLNGFGETLGSLSGTGSVGNGSATAPTLTINNSGNVEFAGSLGGLTSDDRNFGLTKTSGGALTLSGASNYSGATLVSGGKLLVNGSTTSATTVGGGATLGGSGTIGGTLTVNASGNVAPGNSTGILSVGNVSFASGSTFNVEINGNVPGTLHDQLDVTGTVNLGGATLSPTGTITTSSGQLIVLINNDGTDAISGTFASLAEGATVTINTRVFTISYRGGTGNDVTLTQAGTLTFQGTLSNEVIDLHEITISGSVYLQLVVGGAVVEQRLASIVTDVLISGGDGNDTLTIDYGGSGGLVNKLVTFNGQLPTSGLGDSLVLIDGSFTTVTHLFTNANDGSVEINGSTAVTYTGLEPITDSLTAIDRTFTFNGDAESISLIDASGSEMTIDSSSGERVTFSNPSGSLTINAGPGDDAITIQSVNSGFGASLTVNGNAGDDSVQFDGDITLASNNSLAITAEDVTIGTSADLATLGTGTIQITANDIDLSASATLTSAARVTLAPQTAGRPINLGTETVGSLSLTDDELDVISAGIIQVGNATSGVITVSETINPASATDLTLRAGGDSGIAFSGPTGRLNAGTGTVMLALNASGAGGITSGSSSKDIVAGIVSLTSGSAGIGALDNPLVTDASGLSVATNGNAAAFLSEIDSITIGPAGVTTGTGTITLASGTFALGGSNRVNDGSPVVITIGAAFKLNGFDETLNSLTGSGTVVGGAATSSTLTINTSGTETLGTLHGGPGTNENNFGLTKTGSGTLALTRSNTYTGATAVNSGTLLINGSVTSSVTVASGATVGGLGAITSGNTLTVQGGGFVAPGISPGILNTGSLSLESGSTFNVELNGTGAGAVSGYDQINMTGAVSIATNVTLNPTLGFATAPGDTFVILQNDSNDPISGIFDGLPQGSLLKIGGRKFHIVYDFNGGSGSPNDVALITNQKPVISNQSFSVDALAADDSVVGTVLATDGHSAVTYAITAGNTSAAFSINADTGEIRVTNSAALGFSVNPTFNLTVEVTDDALASASATITINVVSQAPTNLRDVDDQADEVPEGALEGSRVRITFFADDAQRDNVFYRLTDNAGGRFAIDHLTGVVTVKEGRLLRFADATQHTIRAIAIDSSGNVSAEKTLTVAVTQVPADALPLASILPTRVSVVEGDAGPNFITFLVKLNKPSADTITIDFSTRRGDDPTFQRPEGIGDNTPFATDQPGPWDFFRSSGQLKFDPGVTEQPLRVQIRPDDTPEANELFFVQLQLPVNDKKVKLAPQQAVVIAQILDDDSFPQLVVSDTQVLEGDADGQNELVFTVRLIGDLPPGKASVTADYSIGNIAIDTATFGDDYGIAYESELGGEMPTFTNELTFTNDLRTREVHVPIKGDTADESDKTVSLRLRNHDNPETFGLSRREVVGTIINDDSTTNVLVAISPAVFKVPENHSGSQLVKFTVTLIGKPADTGQPTDTVSVNYSTANATATAGLDYEAVVGTFDFTPADIATGNIQRLILVTVFGDTEIELDEIFTVALSLAPETRPEISIDPDLASGKVVIRNDDQAILTEDGDALALATSNDLTGLLGAGPRNNPALIAALRARAVQIIQDLGLTKAIVIIIDPVDFVLTDPDGRQSGYTETAGSVNQIPGTYYSGDGAVELLIVPLPPDGTYNVQLAGLGGDFNASITVVDSNGTSTNIVSQNLSDAATTSLSFEVGNTTIPVGLGLAATNSAATAIGVVGAFRNLDFGLALAAALNETKSDEFDFDDRDSLATGLIYWLTVSARVARQQILEPLWQSLESPVGDLLGEAKLPRIAIPSEFVDQFWSQVGQTLTGVPSGIYRLGNMLESVIPTLVPRRIRSTTPRAGDQSQPNTPPVNNGVKSKRSSLERPRTTPNTPPSNGGQAPRPSKPNPTKDKSAQTSDSKESDEQQVSSSHSHWPWFTSKDKKAATTSADRRRA